MIVVEIADVPGVPTIAVARPLGYAQPVNDLARSIPGLAWDSSLKGYAGWPDAVAAFAHALAEENLAAVVGTIQDPADRLAKRISEVPVVSGKGAPSGKAVRQAARKGNGSAGPGSAGSLMVSEVDPRACALCYPHPVHEPGDCKYCACGFESGRDSVSSPSRKSREGASTRPADRRGNGPGTGRALAESLPPLIPSALRPYQREGVEFMRLLAPEGGALLAFDVGLGKTATVLTAARAMIERDGLPRCVVVIGPSITKPIWAAESKKWHEGVFRPIILSGTKGIEKSGYPFLRDNLASNVLPKTIPLVILNYDIAHAWASTLTRFRIGVLACDEAHFLQEPRSRRSRAVREIRAASRAVIMLSGTPMQTRPKDLWNVIDTMAPGRVGVARTVNDKDPIPDPWPFYRRYCTHPATPIWMGDYSSRSIGEVAVGDDVIGWEQQVSGGHERLCRAEVTHVERRKAQAVRVVMESGLEIVCTPDHLWRGYYLDKSHGHLYTNANVGTALVRVTNPVPRKDDSADYMLGYVCGALAGDGTVRQAHYDTGGIKNTMMALRVISEEFASRFARCAEGAGFDVSIKTSPSWSCVNVLGGDSAYRRVISFEPTSDEHWAGWLGGIYDAEGHGQIISQYRKVNPETYDRICAGLQRFGFHYRADPEAIYIRSGADAGRPDLSADRSGIASRDEMLRFQLLCRPVLFYKLDGIVLKGWFKKMDRVVAVHPYGETDVVSLTTTTGNYVAGGLASKNCDAHKETIARDTTVWNIHGSSHEEELNLRLRWIMTRKSKADVLTDLPPRIRQTIQVEIPGSYVLPIWESGENMRRDALSEALSMSGVGKAGSSVELAGDRLAEGHSVLIFTHRRETAKRIFNGNRKDKLKGVSGLVTSPANAALISGDVPVGERTKAVQRLRDLARGGSPVVIVATIDSVGVGMDISFCDVVIFNDLDWVPSKLLQAEGRAHRHGATGESVLVYYLIGVGTADEYIQQKVISRLDLYEKVIGGQAEARRLKEDLERMNGMSEEEILADLRRAVLAGEVLPEEDGL